VSCLIRPAVLFLALAVSAAPAQARPGEVSYRGLCDASAAVALGPEHFVVADDEHDILSIYRLGKRDPTASLDLTDYLGNRQEGKASEADLEGAARIGDRIYWISSHGRTSKGKSAASRHRFFATDIIGTATGPSLQEPTTPPYSRVLGDLIADRRFAVLAKASELVISPEAPGGVNIEGLAATRDGQLLIGFRNPLPENKALLIPLKNPAEVIDKAASPIFGDSVLLDLGGRGIRSIEFIAPGFLIVAGPSGSGKHNRKGFALYSWSGQAADAPQQLKAIDFGTLRPEALFAIPGKQAIYVLSDDGDEKVDGVPCKELPATRQSFRGLALDLLQRP